MIITIGSTMSLDQTLYVVAAILFLVTLIFSIVPVYVFECLAKRRLKDEVRRLSSSSSPATKSRRGFPWPSKDQTLQFLTQLGGGILLHTSLVHMLPEIRVHYHAYLEARAHSEGRIENEESEHEPQFLPDLLVCLGFFAMFAIEESMQALLSAHSHRDTDDGQFEPVPVSLPEHAEIATAQKVLLNPDPRPSLRSQVSQQYRAGSLRASRPSLFSQLSYTACDIINVTIEDNFVQTIEEHKPKGVRYYIFDSLKILLAFSAHSIFDGISIGVQSSPTEVWHLLLAILSHKLLIAFILSFQVYDRCFVYTTTATGIMSREPVAGAKRVLWFFGALFALMSPLGILLVILVMDEPAAGQPLNLPVIVLSALASGTILYLVFLEIIDKSLARVHLNGFTQLVALLVGFGLMHSVVMLSHEH